MNKFTKMLKVFFIFFNVACLCLVEGRIRVEVPRNAFNTELYESALDAELCAAQLRYIVNNSSRLRANFLDSGLRVPRGILNGNFVDLGNYHQCLQISEHFEPTAIEGKYCMINIPLVQEDFELPTLPEWPEEWPGFPWPELLPKTRQHRDMMRDIREIQAETSQYNKFVRPGIDMDLMRVAETSDLVGQAFRLAVCIPKSCTTKQTFDFLYINTTAVGLEISEEFCRLKNDKPFVPGDYAAMGIFGLIILITALCTGYDLYYSLIVKGGPKKISPLARAFSLYTNTRRLRTVAPSPGALECLDGIRALAILWVVVGHTYSTQQNAPFYNRLDVFSWISSLNAIWITSGTITVDTFFLLSGLLVVYTTVGKLSKKALIKNIHLFYLNRLLRMFPVLAAGILLQATLFHHVSDGPEWHQVAEKVERCRAYWWSTLTYLQNYISEGWCIGPTWYLAVDVQLHILSPLVLFWVLGGRRSAWIALSLAMMMALVASTTYNYLNGFQPGSIIPSRSAEDHIKYTQYYYINTLTRCSPFFVGMLYGYLLHVYRGKQVRLPKIAVALGWACAFLVSAGIIYSTYPTLQMDWNNPFLDGVINSFSRPAWAACLGWMIFACTHGFGGPINWFLSLPMWKLPARVSFALYIFHYPLIIIVNSTAIAPAHFSVIAYFYRFLADVMMSLLVSIIVTLMVDSPFSTLIKLSMGGPAKKLKQEKLVEKDGAIDSGVVSPSRAPALEQRRIATVL